MSLKYRIAAVIFLLEALMMVAVFSFTMGELKQANRKYFSKKVQATLKLVGELSRFSLFSAEFDYIQPYIEQVGKDPGILKVLVVDRHNRIVAASDPSLVGQGKPAFGDLSWHFSEIANDSGPLGQVAIEFSQSEIDAANRKAVAFGIRIAIVGMILIAVVGVVTGSLLTRRLAVLSRAATRLADGNMNARTGIKGKDEVAVLGQVFDQMAENIRGNVNALMVNEKELQDARDKLEQRVKERTLELENVNKELEYRALHDSLTGLPNRAMLFEKLRKDIYRTEEGMYLGMAVIDLDYFKEINDTLGHKIGDDVLIAVGERICSVVGQDALVARLGGDEFAIVLPNIEKSRVSACCREVLKSIEPVFDIGGYKLSIAASIGAALYPDHGSSGNQLLQRADMAMYAAKRQRKGFALYQGHDNCLAPSHLSLGSDLRRAIEEDELVLVYQPKINLNTGDSNAAEALLRWNRNGDIISPNDFVPYAERTGLIYPLTEWVLDKAVTQVKSWQAVAMDIHMAVNISTRNLLDKRFSRTLSDKLVQYGMDPAALMLEITETDVMIDPLGALGMLRELKDVGVRLSVDDFGTGYSSLTHLIKLPLDEIKIDQTFVIGMGEGNRESAMIISSVVNLAKNLQVQVAAEGVENIRTLRELDALGCDIVQGDFLALPMLAEEFESWFKGPSWFAQYYSAKTKNRS